MIEEKNLNKAIFIKLVDDILKDDLNELISDVNIFKYSRVPVYKGSIDHVIGILKTKNRVITKRLGKVNKNIPFVLLPERLTRKLVLPLRHLI